MSRGQVLHVGVLDKFISPFIDFLAARPGFDRHSFFFYGEAGRYRIEPRPNVVSMAGSLARLVAIVTLVRMVYRADKIIVHGLFDIKLIVFLFLQPWLLKRCYWVIWGGDLYGYLSRQHGWRWKRNEIFRRFVIRRVGHLVTYIRGDVELARKWYGATGTYHECIMYPSNVFQGGREEDAHKGTINIQVGNSAKASNNHLEILKALEKYKDEDVRIFVPLSYGDKAYASWLIGEGARMFGEKFVGVTGFMPLEEYMGFLRAIDIAIFNHKRQQGMGNIISLLGMGKKVCIREDTSPWEMFRELGISVSSTSNISLERMGVDEGRANREKIEAVFSLDQLGRQWEKVFG